MTFNTFSCSVVMKSQMTWTSFSVDHRSKPRALKYPNLVVKISRQSEVLQSPSSWSQITTSCLGHRNQPLLSWSQTPPSPTYLGHSQQHRRPKPLCLPVTAPKRPPAGTVQKPRPPPQPTWRDGARRAAASRTAVLRKRPSPRPSSGTSSSRSLRREWGPSPKTCPRVRSGRAWAGTPCQKRWFRSRRAKELQDQEAGGASGTSRGCWAASAWRGSCPGSAPRGWSCWRMERKLSMLYSIST